jgi:hypothetical protein
MPNATFSPATRSNQTVRILRDVLVEAGISPRSAFARAGLRARRQASSNLEFCVATLKSERALPGHPLLILEDLTRNGRLLHADVRRKSSVPFNQFSEA